MKISLLGSYVFGSIMRILNKKFYIFSLLFLVGFFGWFLRPVPVLASPIVASQVKLASSPTVYFLSQKYHLKKSYINATAYLSYGNNWSDIKTVSATALADWPEARLFRGVGTPQIYYIKGSDKALIVSPSDLVKFGLTGVPVLDVSLTDLAQYQPVSYAQIGLTAASADQSSNSSSAASSSSSSLNTPLSISLISDPITTANNNALVPGTKLNVLGIFHFDSPQLATVTTMTMALTGVYNSAVISSITATDGSGNDLDANINWRSSDHTITVQFRPPLQLAANSEKTVQILADLNTCGSNDCNNQTMYLNLATAASVQATLPVSASWPLKGSQFTLVSASGVLGRVTAQSLSLASGNAITSGGNRLIGKFAISETSGNEDIIVKQIIFNNAGSANVNDWQNFSLSDNGQTVARASQPDSNGRLVFDINYLRIPANSTADLSVTAEMLSGYNPQDTYDLQMQSLTAVGNTYKMALAPTINNLNESFPLN